MTIIDSSTTGHSRPRERLFAKQLFVGLIVLIVVALAITFMVGQNRALRPAGTTEQPATQ